MMLPIPVNAAKINSSEVKKARYDSISKENHYAARLTQKDVDEIRASEETCMRLAERYGVHYSHISRIKNNQKWRV